MSIQPQPPEEPRSSSPNPRHRRISPSQDLKGIDEGSTLQASETESASSGDISHPSLQRACRNFNAVAVALRGTPFHTVSLVPGTSLVSTTSHSDDVPIPHGSKAIVVACMLSRKYDVWRYLQEMLNVVKPIIVLCVDEGVSFDAEEIHEAQTMFLEVGASDLVLQWNIGADIRLALELRVRTALHAIDRQRYHVQKSMDDQRKKMFWPFVHSALGGFPKLQTNSPTVLQPDVQVGSRYLLNVHGKGSFGTIFKCRNIRSDDIEVMKAIQKSHIRNMTNVFSVWKEIKLLQELQHPNIVRLKHVMHTREHILLFMDYAGPQNLLSYMKSITIDVAEALQIYRQIILGIAYCHQKYVAHRDIKPENVVVRNTEQSGTARLAVRIVDFGLAVKTTEACTEVVGTIPFIAPEVCLKPKNEHYDTARADMWAIGVLLLELLCGIGKVNNMVGWNSERPRSKVMYGTQLESFFANSGRVTSSVEADIGQVGSQSFPWEANEFLLGLLTPYPDRRLTGQAARELSFDQLDRCA